MAYTVLVSSLVRTVDALPVPDPPPGVVPDDPAIPPVTPTPKPPVKKPIGPVPDPQPNCLTIQQIIQALMAWQQAHPGIPYGGASYTVCGNLRL